MHSVASEGAVEVSASVLTSQGWEIARSHQLDAPAEIPIGFDAPGPWYTRWWVWGTIGAVIAGGVAAALLWPESSDVPTRYEVN